MELIYSGDGQNHIPRDSTHTGEYGARAQYVVIFGEKRVGHNSP